MTAIDTNVLVHYHREELPKHREAVALVRAFAEGDTPWAVPVFSLGEFLRVVTHPRVFDPPTSVDDAAAALAEVLKSPTASILGPGQRYWPLLQQVLTQSQAVGNVVFDAQLVALCIEHGVDTLVSEDRDFARFEGVETMPIASYSRRRSPAADLRASPQVPPEHVDNPDPPGSVHREPPAG